MKYQRIAPRPELAPFVEAVWIQEDPRVSPTGEWEPTRVIPTSKIDLILFYGDPFEELSGSSARRIPVLNLTGQRTRSVQVRATGRTGIAIVSFHPWGAAPFFDFPLEEVNDLSVDLGLLIGRSAANLLREEALEARDSAARVAVIESFLLRRLGDGGIDALVAEAARRFNRSCGTVSVDALAKELRLSRRQLTRRFRRATGLPPKALAQIFRFQKAVGHLQSGAGWNEIASRCGYSDQSHFIHEITRFSQLLPSQIAQRQTETDLMRYFNRSKDLSHFYNTTYL